MALRARAWTLAALSGLMACGKGTSPPPPMSPSRVETIREPVVADPPREDGKLPRNAAPTLYAIDLNIDPAKPTFSGTARISITLTEKSRVIVLHARDLDLRSIVAMTSRGSVPGHSRSRAAAGAKEGEEELVLTFDEELPAGPLELTITYEGSFAKQTAGIFRVEEDNTSYVFTTFEPTDARRAFPCFDEPAFRAPFQLTLHVPKGNLAFANTPEKRRTDDGSRITYEFEPTPPLPTYLAAFAVGPFDVIEGSVAPVPLRLIAARGKGKHGKLALEMAAAHLELYRQYFDVPFPFSKLDFVAFPSFGGGGTENAGLIGLREEILLVNESGPADLKRELARAISHEVGHHWFGNLVTMRWWDDIWLKESFTTWIAAKTVDAWKPETKSMLELAIGKSAAMSRDELPGARRMRERIRDAHDAYDELIFWKGAPLIAMVESWLGAEAFRDGVRRYIKKFAWGNVDAPDLYTLLRDASGGREVGKVIASFTDQSGVPLVHTELSCSGSGENKSRPVVHLRQEEYLTLDRHGPSDKRWLIPVCVRYDQGADLATTCTLLEKEEGTIELTTSKGEPARCPSFVFPDVDGKGYYRFALAPADFDRIRGPRLARLNEIERIELLQNAWAAVASGHLPSPSLFDLLLAFRNETSGLVMGEALTVLSAARRSLVTQAARPALAHLLRELLLPTSKRLGFAARQGESEEIALTRADVFRSLGAVGEDPAVVAEAKRITSDWLRDPAEADADLALAALAIAAQKGEKPLFDKLVAVAKSPPSPAARQLARQTLIQFDDPALIERALGLPLDGTLKAQDMRDVLTGLLRRKSANPIAYAWVEKHYEEIKDFPVMPIVLARAPVAICEKEPLERMAAFLTPRLERTDAKNELQLSLETARRCVALADTERARASAWLVKHASSAAR